MSTIRIKLVLTVITAIAYLLPISAEVPIEYFASVVGQGSSKSLAPYMLGSWNQGRYVEGSGIWQEAGIFKRLDMSRRFNWSAGVSYMAGIGSKTRYDRWNENTESWGTNDVRRSAFRLTELYGELKYRAVYLTLGMKNTKSRIVDDHLSSGDLVRSNNAAPIPGVAAGFLDFQNIPFTNGWVQIDGEIMYGKFTDSGFKKNEFNYYLGVEGLNLWYNYKRCYFRTNPNKNFHVTLGMQAAGVFGGVSYSYREGELIDIDKRRLKFGDFLQMFFPMEGGEDYYAGNHIGSWDLKATYRFRDKSTLNFYFEWPWEDGSGIGKLNGWDGLWGIQYNLPDNGIVNKVAFEYLDFTNQSGPMHYDPDDNPNSPLSGRAEGADNYYNNDYYGAYSYYGMSIGTPFLVSPIYNRNGAINYLHTRARGFHFAIEGNPIARLKYRLMVGHEKAGGYGSYPVFKRTSTLSGMLDLKLQPSMKIPQLEIGLKMAFDKGELRENNFGAQVQIAYKGEFNLKKSSK